MNGIDGLAALEAVCVAGGPPVIGVIPEGSFLWALLSILVASTLGLFVWNCPAAKIILGAVCRGFLVSR